MHCKLFNNREEGDRGRVSSRGVICVK
jgi:hypothetical protein